MRTFPRLFAAAAMTAALSAQGVNDVGLTMLVPAGPLSPTAVVIEGQACGAVTCTPIAGSPMAAGDTRPIRTHAAPNTPFVLAIGLQGPCLPIPGIGNSLLLAPVPATLTIGTVSPLSLTAQCQQGLGQQGLGTFTLILGNAPPGVTFRLQALGVSASGQFAFSPAIEMVTQ